MRRRDRLASGSRSPIPPAVSTATDGERAEAAEGGAEGHPQRDGKHLRQQRSGPGMGAPPERDVAEAGDAEREPDVPAHRRPRTPLPPPGPPAGGQAAEERGQRRDQREGEEEVEGEDEEIARLATQAGSKAAAARVRAAPKRSPPSTPTRVAARADARAALVDPAPASTKRSTPCSR